MDRRHFLGATLAALVGSGARIGNAQETLRAIDWHDVTLLDGGVVRADALRGHPVVVEFWASWCPFCARQNPVLQQLYDANRSRGLQVITFSIDIDPQKARDYLRKHRYTFPAAMADDASRRWFGSRTGLPDLYVVDPAGRIVFHEASEMFPEDVLALSRYAAG